MPELPAGFNLVIVCDFGFIQGGASQVALSTAKAVARQGTAVKLFCGIGPPDPELEAMGVQVTCLGSQPYNRDPYKLRALRAGLYDRSAARRFEELLAGLDKESTLVHFHSFVDALSASVPHTAQRLGFPSVFTVHDYNFGCPYGGFFDYRRGRDCPLTGLSAKCWLTNCSTSAYPRKAWRNLRLKLQKGRGVPGSRDHFIAPSEFARRVIEPYLPGGSTLTVLPNPVQAKGEKSVAVGKYTPFVFLGRIAQEKGARLLAQAAFLAGVEAVFIGEGPQQATLNREFPLFRFTGWLPPDAAQAELRKARALVFPSLCRETFGLSVYEAAALGVPAVASDGCAAREAVTDGETGLLFRTGDIGSLTEALLKLKDASLAARIGAEAHSRFWANPPTMERHLSGLLNVYSEVMSGHRFPAETK